MVDLIIRINNGRNIVSAAICRVGACVHGGKILRIQRVGEVDDWIKDPDTEDGEETRIETRPERSVVWIQEGDVVPIKREIQDALTGISTAS